MTLERFAVALSKEGHREEALAFLQNALMARPDFPLAVAFQADLFIEQGNLKDAAASLNPAVAVHPDGTELQNAAGLLALAQKNVQSAEDPDLRTNLGIALEKAGKTEQAKRAYAEAQALRQTQRKNSPTSPN